MRVRLPIFLMLTLISLIGCVASTRPGDLARVQPTSEHPRAGNAYLVRGLIGVFSAGIDDLAAQLNEVGIRAHVYQDNQWPALARRIRSQYRDARDAEPLILVGHSYGADDVVRIARMLDRDGISVDLLVTLDPVTPPAVPGNVRHAVNIYQPNGMWDALPWLRGVPLKPAAAFTGRLENFNIRGDRADLLERRTDHFNIEKKSKVHEEVIGHVLATCPPRQTWLALTGRGLPGSPANRQAVPPVQTRNIPSLGEAQKAGHRPAE